MTRLSSALFLVAVGMASAGYLEENPDDKTLSPYFFVQSDNPKLDKLPLLSTGAEVSIAGVIADVKVTQVYKNDGKRPIEATYVFPASTRAAVYAMKMTIGKRTIEAKIREREQARQDYEQAKQQGKSASLLEQQRPNVFQMNVANIMPGDRIEVVMSYTELLVPTSGVYEFVYPTVVGPRYSNVTESQVPESEQWVASPYQHEKEKPLYTFSLSASINAGLPIQDITCTSHQTTVAYEGATVARISLDKSEKTGGNRDFILKYRLAGGKVETGLLLYQGAKENFFLTMVQPPKRVDDDIISRREYILIMDVSGSMNGFPIDISKKLMRNLLTGFRSGDVFNVVLFAGGSRVLADKSLPATKENIEQAMDVIDRQHGGGGTELLPALQRALDLPHTKGTSRTVIIATDGYVRVEPEAFDLIRENLGKANMFAFGIGSSVNRHIIEGMAHVGMGEPFVITKPDQAAAQAEKFRTYIAAPVLTGVEVDFQGFDAYDIEPVSIPDVMAERPVIVFGKWRGDPAGTITVRGRAAGDDYEQEFYVPNFRVSEGNSALRYLWARHRIQLLADYNNLQHDDKRVKEVTELGLGYNLLTQYTSFVAIDNQVRNIGGKQTTVSQALPMPEGVSDNAIGGGGAMGYAAKSAGAMPMTTTGHHSAKPAMSRPLASEPGDKANLQAEEKTTVKVLVKSVDVKGGLSEKTVKTALDKLLPDLRLGYAEALKLSASLKGRLTIKFQVQPDGTLSKVEVVANELNQDLADRLLKILKDLTVSNPSGSIATATIVLLMEP